MDIYEQTNLLTAVEQVKPVRRWLLDRYFSNIETSAAESITFDIVKGRRTIAPYVSSRVAGKVLDKKGYRTDTYKPAYLKPKSVTTAGDFLKRMAGEVLYGGSKSPEQRAAEKLIEEMTYLDDSITRRLEQMCSEVIHTGKIVVKGDGIDDEIDFGMDPDNLPVFSGSSLWTAHSTAKPLTDFKTLKRMALNKSGVAPVDVIFGTNAYDNFLQCEEIVGSSTKKSLLDLTRVQLGQINPTELPGGVVYVGRITECALDIWTYDEWYVDEDSGIEQPMINPDSIILGSPNGLGVQCYGAIKDVEAIEAGLFAVPRYPKVWIEKDPSARMIMLQSAPLIVPKIVDSWVCAKVC